MAFGKSYDVMPIATLFNLKTLISRHHLAATPPPKPPDVDKKMGTTLECLRLDQRSEFWAGPNFSVVNRVGKIDYPIRGTPYSLHGYHGDLYGGQNGQKWYFWPFFKIFGFFFLRNAVKSIFYGLKSRTRYIFGYFLVRDAQDPV